MELLRIVLILLFLSPGYLRAETYPFLTIKMPGFYQLASNVSNQITISASDVTLDMNGGTVSGGTNGIVINSGLNNVTVKNGVITSVSSNGIQVGAGCSNITIKDVHVKNAIRGIDCEQVTNGLIKNCDFNVSTTGLLLDACHNITVQHCTARANTHAGYDVLSSTTCSFIECSALSTGQGNSTLYGNTVFGFVSANGNGNIFERCIANSTQALSTTDSNSLIAGFALRGSEGCTKIIDSEGANSQTNVNGFTVPYGILLEGTLDSVQSITGDFGSGGPEYVWKVAWSPDGQYVAVSALGLADTLGNQLQIFQFDRVARTLTSITAALGIVGEVYAIDWSPDGNYIAVGGVSLPGNVFQVFKFNRATGTLTSIAGALGTAPSILSVNWSPDGNYIAVGGDLLTGSNEFQVFRFDRAVGTVTSIAGALGTAGFVYSVNWSPDGQYVAVGGDGLSGGTGHEFQIFRFNRAAGTLTSIAGALGTAALVYSVNWSPDGNYIAVGGTDLTGGNEFQVFKFDRAAGTVTSIAGALGTAGDVYSANWSPDGQYIGVGGLELTGSNELQIFSGLQFPGKNVIKGNTVYCNSGAQFPSGVGISAPSISNMVIGNTAFNNPIPRGANAPIVESNYAFVTNVFNQLFGDAPTALQNISLSGIDPILNRFDIPGGLNRLEALAESLIDNLL